MKKKLRFFSIVIFCLFFMSSTGTTIRVVAYNCANHPNNTTEENHFRTIFQAIGNESVNGIAKRLDILVMSEMDGSSATKLTDLMNDLYSVNKYVSILSSSVGGDRTGIIYDTSTVSLIASNDLMHIGTRSVLRAQFRITGSTDVNQQFFVYAIHLKSGSNASDITLRADEASKLRSNADSLGQGIHIIYAGDFNITGSSEGAWTNMLATGNGQAFDPVNAPGEWRDNSGFKHLHSQDPGAAMDDRFDFIFISDEFNDGNGIDYASNSFQVFGNNGTHTLDDAITTGTGATPNVLTALENVSDHLPVIADFTLVDTQPTLKQQLLQRIDKVEQELIQLRMLVEQLQ